MLILLVVLDFLLQPADFVLILLVLLLFAFQFLPDFADLLLKLLDLDFVGFGGVVGQ